MAAALTGVQRSQPALVTRPVAASLPASPAAALRATALASVPPNQAERPRSWSVRDRVLRAMVSSWGWGVVRPSLPPSPVLMPVVCNGSRGDQVPYRSAARCRAFTASTSRSLGGAVVTSESSSRVEAAATSATARSKASALARDGFVAPLILRTYCRAAARISSSVAAGSKFESGRMFRHMTGSVGARAASGQRTAPAGRSCRGREGPAGPPRVCEWRAGGPCSGAEAGPVDLAVVALADRAADQRAEERDEQNGHEGDDPGGGGGALVDRDPRQVQLLQHVVLRTQDRPGGGQDQDDEQADQPHGHALTGTVEPCHAAGHVAAGQVGQEEDDEDGDAAPDAERLRLRGRLIRCVDAPGQPERDPRGGQQRDQQDRQTVGRQPAEERRPPADPAEDGALGGHRLTGRSAPYRGAAGADRSRRLAVGVVVPGVVVLGPVVAGHPGSPPCRWASADPSTIRVPVAARGRPETAGDRGRPSG